MLISETENMAYPSLVTQLAKALCALASKSNAQTVNEDAANMELEQEEYKHL